MARKRSRRSERKVKASSPAAGKVVKRNDVDSIAREAYVWGWPLVNAANKRKIAAKLPNFLNPILVNGMPVAYQRIGMLTDYISPEERVTACPNQDTVYGSGVFKLGKKGIVIQVPYFGRRYWVYALYDARTNQFAHIGKQYDTPENEFYLMVGPDWDGQIPNGIPAQNVLPASPTTLAFAIPRIFVKDTPEDRQAIQQSISQIDFYPSKEFDGTMKTHDWANEIPQIHMGRRKPSQNEIQYVKPRRFFPNLRRVLKKLKAQPDEQDIYTRAKKLRRAWILHRKQLETIAEEQESMIANTYMQWSNDGVAVSNGNNWYTSVNSAAWTFSDYIYRTATAKSNMFENRAEETRYYFTDTDSDIHSLNGGSRYIISFKKGQLPPLADLGFWSLTLYDKSHFFYYPNTRNTYSLGTKNEDLKYNPDGSLDLYAGFNPPEPAKESNWLPAPSGEPFSLYLRVYRPDAASIGAWLPPQVKPY